MTQRRLWSFNPLRLRKVRRLVFVLFGTNLLLLSWSWQAVERKHPPVAGEEVAKEAAVVIGVTMRMLWRKY